MTDTPPSPFQDRINTAVATACPKHSHCDLVGPAVWAVVRPELEQPYAEAGELATELADARTELQQQDEEIKRLREQVAAYENGITWHTTCLNCAKLLAACHTETTRAEQAEAALEAAEDQHARQLQDRDAEIAEAEKQIRTAEDELDRLRDRGERARIELDALRDLARGATDLRKQLAVSDRLRASGLDLHEKVVRKLVDAEAERDQLKATLQAISAAHPGLQWAEPAPKET